MKYRDPFYLTPEWKKLRHEVLKRHRYYCKECNALCLGKRNGINPHVDHILPRKEFPKLAMDMGNLQVLCHSCHSRKTIRATFDNEPPAIGLDGFPVEPLEAPSGDGQGRGREGQKSP